VATFQDYSEPPADQSTPYAQRQRIAASLRSNLPAVDHNGSAIKPTAAPEAVVVPDALGMTEPATALAVLKAADRLGVDHATVNTLLDSAAFVAAVTGAAPEEISAAITARTVPPRPVMMPNPAQGSSGRGAPSQPPSFKDRISASLDHANSEGFLGPRAF
jgi:hypothetical protein